MTEEEWLACQQPHRMLEFLRNKGSDRKRRLFSAACYCRVTHLIRDEMLRRAIQTAEKFIEGRGKRGEVKTWWKAIDRARRAKGPKALQTSSGVVTVVMSLLGDCFRPQLLLTSRACAALTTEKARVPWYMAWANARVSGREEEIQALLLHDILGNPFRPVTVSPSWQSANVVSLAHAIYEERAFDRLPILADALEDVGCTNGEILAHCRGPGPHVRGCWVVDLLLGKE